MADITISELELTDDILDDMTIPVETPSKTFSATLKQLKNYIGGDLPLGSIIPNVGVLNDERFTLLDGKTLASNGTYAEFYRKAVENIANGHWVQCTEEEFNSDVSNYGSCGKFVVTDEYIRIPKITKFIGATNILSEIGDTLSGNVPSQNITVQSGTGATVKALASDLKNTQSTHTKYYYYMKVSTEGQKEPIEIDINEVYEDLEIKANKDLSNLNEDGGNYIDSRITSIMNTIYPVGSIYISTNSTNPMATLISGSTWELVSSGKALWTGDGSNANTTISAGLPNITGGPWVGGYSDQITTTGAVEKYYEQSGGQFTSSNKRGNYKFNASLSNSIYGASTTVQPPAYVVNVWRRTA